jgi:hypothetical protein
MMTLLFVAAAGAAVIVLLSVLALLGFFLKLVFWVVFLPIRLIFGALGLLLGALAAPLVLAVLAIAAIAGIAAILLPLTPILILALVGWAIYKSAVRRPSPVV